MILALLLACAEPAPVAPVASDGPKVVVIVTDTVRADLGGAEWPAWAEGGRRYTNAFSAAPYTTASTPRPYPLPASARPPERSLERLVICATSATEPSSEMSSQECSCPTAPGTSESFFLLGRIIACDFRWRLSVTSVTLCDNLGEHNGLASAT